MSRRFVLAVAFILATMAAAQAGVVVVVNKSTQRLAVSVDGVPRYEWSVSTARQGYNTPNGTYGVERMEVSWFSRRYDWSPMPHSIFFNGGYAIHGSNEIGRLGTPASHGCIRLHPNNATTLYNLVQANRGSTRIVVTGGGAPGLFMSNARSPRHAGDDDRPARGSRARSSAYIDGDDIRSPRSIRGQRARSRSHDFEDIFN
jgi:hypothetical protein